MIRLIVISDSPPTVTQYFKQPVVTIGCAHSPFADLALAEEALLDTHIQIIQEQQQYFAINKANDPFATLNGKPFGKKKLAPNDLIQVGNATIRFELIIEPPAEAVPPVLSMEKPSDAVDLEKLPILENNKEQFSDLIDTKELLPIILEKKLSDFSESLEKENSSFSLDIFTEEEDQLPSPENIDMFYENYSDARDDIFDAYDDDTPFKLIDGPIHSSSEHLPQEFPEQNFHEPISQPLVHQTPHPLANSFATITISSLSDNSVPEVEPPPPTKTLQPLVPSNPTKLSLKDYYLREYDDVGDDSHAPVPGDALSSIPKILISVHSWIVYLKAFAIFAILALIGLWLVYLWMSGQSDKEEVTASKGVADVAMALTYAQIKNIHPQNQNWSDPEFIKTNLMAVLPSKYFSHAEFDAHGQFINCPYFLRIYTSGDLSQFLVIAQPAPSVLQWLIPKSTIIIDSHAMEMRKTTDLKSLNRLLASANTLEGTSAVEVSHLVRQGSPLSLANLVNNTENDGFSPPKALGLIRPGAENLVYNAPRYFPLSEELMKKTLDLIENPASSHEVIQLQQELSILKKLPDIVLYVSGGIQNAIHAQKALITLSPKDKFLIGYLQINNKSHLFNSHLLIDDSIQETAVADNNPILSHLTKASSEDSMTSLIPTEFQKNVEIPPLGTNLEEDNPLFLQFSALNVFRQQALRPLCEEIVFLLNQETHAAQKDFEAKIKNTLAKYIEVDNEQQAKIQRKIDSIYHENSHVSAAQFFHLAKAAGIKQSLIDFLNYLKRQQKTPEFTQEKLDKSLQKIERASNWQNFEQEVAELVEILNVERIPDEETIIAYQHAARSRIIQKLNQFILSPENPHILQAFDVEYRYTLIHILKMSWITDPDTYDFYLNEFDLRAHPRGSTQSEEGDDDE
jgi:hypothetical protein